MPSFFINIIETHSTAYVNVFVSLRCTLCVWVLSCTASCFCMTGNLFWPTYPKPVYSKIGFGHITRFSRNGIRNERASLKHPKFQLINLLFRARTHTRTCHFFFEIKHTRASELSKVTRRRRQCTKGRSMLKFPKYIYSLHGMYA